jgi:hypothetical protein
VFRSLAVPQPQFLSTQRQQQPFDDHFGRTNSLEEAEVMRAVAQTTGGGDFWASFNKQGTGGIPTHGSHGSHGHGAAKELSSGGLGLAMPTLSALAPKSRDQGFQASNFKLNSPSVLVSSSGPATTYTRLQECPVWFNKYYASLSYEPPASILASICAQLKQDQQDFVVASPSVVEGITRCGMKFSVNLYQFSASNANLFGVQGFDSSVDCVLVEVNREQGCAFGFCKFYRGLSDSYKGTPIVASRRTACTKESVTLELEEELVDAKCLESLLDMVESEYVGDVAKNAVDTINRLAMLKHPIANQMLEREDLLVRATNVAVTLLASADPDVRMGASTLLLNLCPWQQPQAQVVEKLSDCLPALLHDMETDMHVPVGNHELLAMRRCREQLRQVSREIQLVI